MINSRQYIGYNDAKNIRNAIIIIVNFSLMSYYTYTKMYSEENDEAFSLDQGTEI